MSKSTTSPRRHKSSKQARRPNGFPLFAHQTGRWCKKVRGKFRYFGKTAGDPDGQRALAMWLEQKDDLLADRPPRAKTEGLTARELINSYLTTKRHLLDSGEITARTFGEYYATSERVIAAFGKDRAVASLTDDDFETLRAQLAKTRGPVTLGNEVQRVRMIFRFGHDQGLIDQPMRYGQSFNKPSKKVLRKSRAESGPRMFEAAELQAILSALDGTPVAVTGKKKPARLRANPILHAMVLLAANCGFGQTDIACLPLSALDLSGGWVTFPRPKTGIERRAKLWPESLVAIREVLTTRPTPRESTDADLVFLTAKGRRWVRASGGDDPAKWSFRTDLIGNEFAKVLKELDVNGRRGFYAIRRSFQTAAERCRDFPAIRYVMGHSDASMNGVYRDRIDDKRLEEVVDHVHQWLYAKSTKGPANRRARKTE